MVVALPFCAKDRVLALKNLKIAQALDGQQDMTCVLSYDASMDPIGLEQEAAKCFKTIEHCRYDPPTEQQWPMPQNWAWQSTARYMAERQGHDPWYWWEADVVPLARGWLRRIADEHAASGKPFLGHVVPAMGHMNGAAVYPANVADYSNGAMLCRAAAWDIVLAKETEGLVQAANHFMSHFPRFNGVMLHFGDRKPVRKLTERGMVCFHGSNDGSLHDLMLGAEPQPAAAKSRLFTETDAERDFDEAEPIWQQERDRLEVKGQPILAWDDCRQSVKPFRQQTNWECGQFNLEPSVNKVHFNPGLVRDGKGALWLLARRWDRLSARHWNSRMMACVLDGSMRVVRSLDLCSENFQYEQHEDPRVIWRDGYFWVSYCSWIRTPDYSPRQQLACFDSDWNSRHKSQPLYGWNAQPHGGAEKNWIWFFHENKWHFVYQFNPHVVVRMDDAKRLGDYKTPVKCRWKYGEIRGGTPPVRIGSEYWSFFHSSLPWRNRQKRYHMGAYAFLAQPPFSVTRVTAEPLLSGSEHDTRILGSPVVIFPCGAVLEHSKWTVSFGVNDEACGWIRIPHGALEERMAACT